MLILNMVMNRQVPQQVRGFKIIREMVHADMWILWWTFKFHNKWGDLKLLMKWFMLICEHGDEPSSSATGEGI